MHLKVKNRYSGNYTASVTHRRIEEEIENILTYRKVGGGAGFMQFFGNYDCRHPWRIGADPTDIPGFIAQKGLN